MLTVQSRALVGLNKAVGLEVSRSASSSALLFFDGLLALLSPFLWMTTEDALRFCLDVSSLVPHIRQVMHH